MIKKIVLTVVILVVMLFLQGLVFAQGMEKDTVDSSQEDRVYSVAYLNILPHYPGGAVGLKTFVKDNFHFSEGFKKKRYKGKVYISFIIEK